MRRFLLLVVSIASLALPAGAFARGGDYGFEGGTPAQRSQVRAALGASTFDWSAVPTRVTSCTAYGSPSDGSFASRPKTNVKMTSPASGCNTAHATPNSVCR